MENIWQTAKSMEREGIAFYQKLSNESTDDRLSALFYFLAQQEQDHLNFFDKIEKKLSVNFNERDNEPKSLEETFEKIKPSISSKSLPSNEREAYSIAITMETKAVAYYNSLLPQVENEEQKAALQIIINEERNHESMMTEMLDSME